MRRCVTKFPAACGQRHTSTGAWTLVTDIRNLNAAKHFKRQVISRLSSDYNDTIFQMSEYRISNDSIADFEAAKRGFLSKYFETDKPGEVSSYAWPMPKQMRPQVNQMIEADLYLKVPAGFKPSTLLCDNIVATIAPDPLPHAYHASLERPGVVLCEVAEKPSDILNKALQILCAIKCCSFPEGALPCIAVICVIGGSEDDAKNASAFLFAGLEGGKLEGIPLAVSWAPYRNINAEIGDIHDHLRGANEGLTRIDESLTRLNTRMSGLENSVSELISMTKVLIEKK